MLLRMDLYYTWVQLLHLCVPQVPLTRNPDPWSEFGLRGNQTFSLPWWHFQGSHIFPYFLPYLRPRYASFYPGPRGFSWFFFAKEIKSKPRSGDNESRKRRGEREKPLVTLASNLTFMKTTGSGSDPQALIGWYFFKHAKQFDWLV